MFNMNFADMKKILYIAICLLLGLGMSACFEDEGNYEYHELPAFYVDTVGVQTALTITQFDALSMEPGRTFSPGRLMLNIDPFYAAGISVDPEYRQSDVLIKPSLSAAPRVQPEPAVLFLFKIPV